jgi:alpha-L-arabinofuranosidase
MIFGADCTGGNEPDCNPVITVNVASVGKAVNRMILGHHLEYPSGVVSIYGGNIIENSGFENTEKYLANCYWPGISIHWFPYGDNMNGGSWRYGVDPVSDPEAQWSLDSTDKVEGKYSQRITVTGAHSGSYRGIKHCILVKNGHTYRLRFWCKASGGITFVQVSCSTANNVPPQYPSRTWITGKFNLTSNWQEFIHEFTVNDNRSDTVLLLNTAGQNGTIWFDNVKLLDLTQPTKQIEPQLLSKYKELGITSIRWAGSFINSWHWKDETINPDLDNRYFTIDHFMQIAEALGAEPFITVNYGSGTAQEAADLVEYLNGSLSTTYGSKRSANGHTEPYNAKWFILGNEFPGNWEVCEPNRDRCDTAIGYGSGVLEFSNAMKAKDPNIKIVAVGSFDPDWNREFVGIAGCDSWDAYDFHFYSPGGYPCTPTDPTKRHNRLTEEETFYAAMSGPDEWGYLLWGFEEGWGVDSFKGICPNKVPVPIFSSEWNDLHTTNASVNSTVCNEIFQHLASLEAGLYAAVEIPMAMRSKYQWSMNWFQLVGGRPTNYSTSILDSWDNPQFRPSGLVYKLANAHLTGNLLAVNLKSSWYSNKSLGYINATTRPHLVVAAVKVSSSKIKLWVVNRHYSKALTSKITIQNFTPNPMVKTFTLNATNTTDVYATIVESTTTVKNTKNTFTYTFPAHSLTVIDINSM